MDRRTLILAGAGAAAALCLPSRAQEVAPRMRSGQPSATARGAAMSRALHQILDAPRVLDDRFAVPIVAPASAEEIRATLEGATGLRAGIVLRSRYAEDRLAEAVARGVRQYVVLGAGLDTFLLRNPHRARGLKVFEVDHPATQAWKREHLARAELAVPAGVAFVGVDFETQSLDTQLKHAGFRFDRPAFFSMLGVVIYLTHEAVMGTMAVVARCARGSEIVFSYSVPDAMLGEEARMARRRSMARMATIGEPWITFYEPAALADELRAAGFHHITDLGPDEANRRHFAGRSDNLRVSTGHIMLAST